MLTRAKGFSLSMAVLLMLTLMPGAPIGYAQGRPTTAAPPTDAVNGLPNGLNGHVVALDPSNPFNLFAKPSDSATADAENVEFVGHIGGPTYTVAVQGNYAYIGEGPRLTILDMSNPASPAVAGKTPPLFGSVRGVYVAGGYAYVADYHGGLRVVDVSTPSDPTEVGFYDTPGGLGRGRRRGLRLRRRLGCRPAGSGRLQPGQPDRSGLLRHPAASLGRGRRWGLCLRRRYRQWPAGGRHLRSD